MKNNYYLERFLKHHYKLEKLTAYTIGRHQKDLREYGEDIIAKEDTKTGEGVRFNDKLEVLPMTLSKQEKAA
jgi:hypothetical protein